ncbi:hypothetical protein D3C81_1429400 [compost metagenome]
MCVVWAVTRRPVGTLGAVVSLFSATTVMRTVAERVLALRLSVATAVSEWLPLGALRQSRLYGVWVSTPSDTRLLKNSTLLMLPSLSAALAVTVMALPAVKVDPEAGEVRVMRGAWLATFPPFPPLPEPAPAGASQRPRLR